jgi:hypothetical protein
LKIKKIKRERKEKGKEKGKKENRIVAKRVDCHLFGPSTFLSLRAACSTTVMWDRSVGHFMRAPLPCRPATACGVAVSVGRPQTLSLYHRRLDPPPPRARASEACCACNRPLADLWGPNVSIVLLVTISAPVALVPSNSEVGNCISVGHIIPGP